MVHGTVIGAWGLPTAKTSIVVAHDALGNTLSLRQGKVLRTWVLDAIGAVLTESVPDRIDRTFTYARPGAPRDQESLPLKCVSEI
jgi:hypothetical protein